MNEAAHVTVGPLTFHADASGQVHAHTASGDWAGSITPADGETLSDTAGRYVTQLLSEHTPQPLACGNCDTPIKRTAGSCGNPHNALGITLNGWWGGWRDLLAPLPVTLCGSCAETLRAALPGVARKLDEAR